MTHRQIWLNLGGLGVLIALLGLAYWLNTGARAVPGLMEMLRTDDVQAQVLAAQSLGHLGLEAKAAVPDLLTLARSNTNLNASAVAAAALPAIDLSAARLVMAHYLPALQAAEPQTRRDECCPLHPVLGVRATPPRAHSLRQRQTGQASCRRHPHGCHDRGRPQWMDAPGHAPVSGRPGGVGVCVPTRCVADRIAGRLRRWTIGGRLVDSLGACPTLPKMTDWGG